MTARSSSTADSLRLKYGPKRPLCLCKERLLCICFLYAKGAIQGRSQKEKATRPQIRYHQGRDRRREEQNWRHFAGLCAVLVRSPNRKRRKRAGTIDIGTWPSPATAAVPKPSRIIPKITTPNMKRPVRVFLISHAESIEHPLTKVSTLGVTPQSPQTRRPSEVAAVIGN